MLCSSLKRVGSVGVFDMLLVSAVPMFVLNLNLASSVLVVVHDLRPVSARHMLVVITLLFSTLETCFCSSYACCHNFAVQYSTDFHLAMDVRLCLSFS